MLTALPTLTPYQIAWLKVPRYRWVTLRSRAKGTTIREQKATIKCLTKSRRIGGSFACQLESVLSGVGIDYGSQTDCDPMDTYVLSATERQAKDFIKECGELAEFFSDSDARFQCKVQSTQITFLHTHKRIIALPASGRAVRGVTGRLVLDEVCFMPKFDEIWGAAIPISRGNMKEPRGYPVSVLSTPWAKGTEAHRVLSRGSPYYCFEVDLQMAIEQGFKGVRSAQAIREEVGNDEIYNVEYMCKWLETGNAYFPEHIIKRAIMSESGSKLDKRYKDNPVIWGVDIGRTHDLTVAAKFVQAGDIMYLTDLYKLRGTPMHEQAELLCAKIGDNPTLIRVDRGLQGYSVYDAFIAKYGREVVHSADLNQDSQVKHMMNLKNMLERETLKIAGDFSEEPSKTLMTELLKIEQKSTSGGRVVMHTPRDMHGHCDRAWAVAIGLGKYIRDTQGDNKEIIIGEHKSLISAEREVDAIKLSIQMGLIEPDMPSDDWLYVLCSPKWLIDEQKALLLLL
jgi:phage FluMu gp28-like protein